MERNNKNRISQQDILSTVQAAAPQTNQVSLAIPSEWVELPSQGKLYPPGHPLNGKTSLEIRFMTAHQEDILSSTQLLAKGPNTAIDAMLQSLIVDPSIKIEDMLVGDKDALAIAARISGYGPEYGFGPIICPQCQHEHKRYDFDLSQLKMKQNVSDELMQELNLSLSDGKYKTILPKSKVQVEFKLLSGRDSTNLTKSLEKRIKGKMVEASITDMLKMIIVSVNSDTNPSLINQFVDSMPALDSKTLKNLYVKVSPGIERTQEFICEACSYSEEIEVPITARFFWPGE